VLLALIRRSRINEAAPEHRPRLDEMMSWLQGLERGESAAPTIGQLLDILGQCLALVDDNFGVIRRGGGDILGYATVLTRHSLYRYLWGGASVAPGNTGK
jgi:hypothetical protein